MTEDLPASPPAVLFIPTNNFLSKSSLKTRTTNNSVVFVVSGVQLLHDNEGDDGVWTETEVIRPGG